MTRTTDVDGQPWRDGQVTAGVWQRFGTDATEPLESETVRRPLSKIWPQERPKPAKKVA